MKVIRRGVFETNSSSTHSITMCSRKDYDRWFKGEVFLDWHADSPENSFITREEAVERLKKKSWSARIDFNDEDAVNEALWEMGIVTPDKYFGSDYLESYEDSYTTAGGEEVIAFGVYGRDC